MANYILDLLQREGHKVEQQTVEGERINLIIHDETPPKVVLFGHMDTVEPSSETVNPLGARIDGENLYGLGNVWFTNKVPRY